MGFASGQRPVARPRHVFRQVGDEHFRNRFAAFSDDVPLEGERPALVFPFAVHITVRPDPAFLERLLDLIRTGFGMSDGARRQNGEVIAIVVPRMAPARAHGVGRHSDPDIT